jgi:hypothetical protein
MFFYCTTISTLYPCAYASISRCLRKGWGVDNGLHHVVREWFRLCCDVNIKIVSLRIMSPDGECIKSGFSASEDTKRMASFFVVRFEYRVLNSGMTTLFWYLLVAPKNGRSLAIPLSMPFLKNSQASSRWNFMTWRVWQGRNMACALFPYGRRLFWRTFCDKGVPIGCPKVLNSN